MNFTIDSTIQASVPTPEFFADLVSSVIAALNSATLTRAQGKALCEYLDCLDARLAGLSRKHGASAKTRLARFLGQEASEACRQALCAASPAARRAVRAEAQPEGAQAAQAGANLAYLFG